MQAPRVDLVLDLRAGGEYRTHMSDEKRTVQVRSLPTVDARVASLPTVDVRLANPPSSDNGALTMLGLLFVAWGTFKIVDALDRLACVHDGQTLDACIEAQEADDE